MIYVISPKDAYAARRLLEEARIRNYELRIMNLNDLFGCNFQVLMIKGDVLYIRNPYLNGKPNYLPQIIKMAKKFKDMGGRVVDSNITRGYIGKGKWEDYKKFKKAGVPIPKTTNLVDSEQWSVISKQKKNLLTTHYPLPITNYKLILRWIYGLKARGTFLISSRKDLKRIPKYIPRKELMIQEFIKAKYEYKVITVGYKALPVILRFGINKNGFRTDFASYCVIPSECGRAEESLQVNTSSNVKGSLHSASGALRVGRDDRLTITYLAERASKVLGRELAKVDILEDYKGKLYVLEVNRFPGLESFEKLTGYNVFKEFVKYLKI